MKTGIIWVALLLLEAGQLRTGAQSAFVNLGFESANVPEIPAGTMGVPVPTEAAIPGWAAYLGQDPMPQAFILHNEVTTGGAAIGLFGPEWSDPTAIVDGEFSLGLTSEPFPGGRLAAIGQTGQVPADARSILFRNGVPGAGTAGLEVTFGGIVVPLIRLSSTPAYDVLAGDLSLFAGQTGELRFTAVPVDGSFPHAGGGLLEGFLFGAGTYLAYGQGIFQSDPVNQILSITHAKDAGGGDVSEISVFWPARPDLRTGSIK